MTLKCSLLGHAFDDGEVEREREEQGSEVVSTIRETETCTRCGAERVVSENTEVTALETPSDIVGDDLAEGGKGEPAPTTEAPAEDETTSKAAGTGAGGTGADGVSEAPDRAAAESGAAPDPGEGPTPDPSPAAGPDSDPDPAEDDGVILDEGDNEADERAPGEWPGAEGSGGEDGASDTPSEGDGESVAEWPEEEADDGDDWAPETDAEATEVEPTSTAVTVPEGNFRCPECGFSTPVEDSSLRAGDFCPECHRGSLEHRS